MRWPPLAWLAQANRNHREERGHQACQGQTLLTIRIHLTASTEILLRAIKMHASNEALEHPFKGFSLSDNMKCVVVQSSDDTYDVRRSGDEEQRWCTHTHTMV